MAERIMLNINHIAKTFNPGTITEKRALTDVDLKLNEGDFVTIIGGNGAQIHDAQRRGGRVCRGSGHD